MNYEMQMLKGAVVMRKAAAKLDRKCKELAIRSFSVENWSDGTFGQFRYISALVEKRDEWQNIFEVVRRAIADMPKESRILFYKRYVGRQSNAFLQTQTGVSPSTLCRLVSESRQCFIDKLSSYGYTQRWFDENFHAMLFDAVKMLG